MVTRNETKNGGAVSPWESIALKPMSFKIVGKNTISVNRLQSETMKMRRLPGSDEKPTLQLKYMNCTKSASGTEKTITSEPWFRAQQTVEMFTYGCKPTFHVHESKPNFFPDNTSDALHTTNLPNTSSFRNEL